MIAASQPSWIAPFTGLSPRCFDKLVTMLRREGADAARRGRPWSLPLEDRVLLVAAYWRTNLTLRQLAPLFGVSKSAADRIVHHLGPLLALRPRKRFRADTVLIADGTLVPTRDHTVAEKSKNYRYSTNHQVVIDADTRLVVVVGRPLPGNRNDCKAWALSGAKGPRRLSLLHNHCCRHVRRGTRRRVLTQDQIPPDDLDESAAAGDDVVQGPATGPPALRIARGNVRAHIPDALGLAVFGKVSPDGVVSHVLDWEQLPEALLEKRLKPVFVRDIAPAGGSVSSG